MPELSIPFGKPESPSRTGSTNSSLTGETSSTSTTQDAHGPRAYATDRLYNAGCSASTTFQCTFSTAVAGAGPDADHPCTVGTRSRFIGEAAGFETLFNRSDPSPWTGVELRDGQAVQNAVDLASRLNYEVIPSLTDNINRVSESSGLRQPKTMGQVNDLLTVVRQTHQTLASYVPSVFADAGRSIDSYAARTGRWYQGCMASNHEWSVQGSLQESNNTEERRKGVWQDSLS